ncbi:MAG: hypothetical protein NZ749_05730 [bacterium]|nr:hypothetical protein [bacterium]
MHAYLRYLTLVLLIGQGVYDLALGGWLWLPQAVALSAASSAKQERLHALYCHCKHCQDIAKCCCVPSPQMVEHTIVRQCDAADEGKVPNTWSCRILVVSRLAIPLLVEDLLVSPDRLPLLLVPEQIEHPPRTWT